MLKRSRSGSLSDLKLASRAISEVAGRPAASAPSVADSGLGLVEEDDEIKSGVAGFEGSGGSSAAQDVKSRKSWNSSAAGRRLDGCDASPGPKGAIEEAPDESDGS